MAVVMKLCGLIDMTGHWQETPDDGQYLRDFDFEAEHGRGLITMTPDLQQAKQFDDLAEALAFRARSPECQPTRPDGQPNRPLTATNWEFVAL